MTRRDIVSAEDVRQLVGDFYARIMRDPAIGHFFTHLDLAAHLPRIEAFWRMVLLGDRSYVGDPMTAHIRLDQRHRMEQRHFDAWLRHWEDTVDELFAGPNAEEAKARARTIAPVMLHKVVQARGA